MKNKTTKQHLYRLINVKTLTLSVVLILLTLTSMFTMTSSQIALAIEMEEAQPVIPTYEPVTNQVSCEPISDQLEASNEISEEIIIEVKAEMLAIVTFEDATLPLASTPPLPENMLENQEELSVLHVSGLAATAPEFATEDDNYEYYEDYLTIDDTSNIDTTENHTSEDTQVVTNEVSTIPSNTLEKMDEETLIEYCKQRAATWVVKEVPNVDPLTELTPEEIDLIQRVVECEVRGEQEKYYLGKLAVANVILNRYRTDYWEFPDTIEGVLYQEGQFHLKDSEVVKNIKVSELTKKAVNDAINGIMAVEPNVYYFCTVDTGGKDWFEYHETLEFYGYLNPHDFYGIDH